MTKIASFLVSRGEADKIRAIVDRAMRELDSGDQRAISMALTACHANGCPLDLDKLLAASTADFGHDVNGIQRYIDTISGELTEHFLPRCHA